MPAPPAATAFFKMVANQSVTLRARLLVRAANGLTALVTGDAVAKSSSGGVVSIVATGAQTVIGDATLVSTYNLAISFVADTTNEGVGIAVTSNVMSPQNMNFSCLVEVVKSE